MWQSHTYLRTIWRTDTQFIMITQWSLICFHRDERMRKSTTRLTFHKGSWAHKWNLVKTHFAMISIHIFVVDHFCTCHDSWAIAACTTLEPGWIIIYLTKNSIFCNTCIMSSSNLCIMVPRLQGNKSLWSHCDCYLCGFHLNRHQISIFCLTSRFSILDVPLHNLFILQGPFIID